MTVGVIVMAGGVVTEFVNDTADGGGALIASSGLVAILSGSLIAANESVKTQETLE